MSLRTPANARRPLAPVRRSIGIVAVLALVLGGLFAVRSGGERPGPAGSQEIAAETADDISTGDSPDDAGPAAEVPDGPGSTAPGIVLAVTILDDGSLDVAETVRFADPVRSVVLRPPDLRRGGSLFTDASPRAREVQIDAEGQPLDVPDATVGERVRLETPETSRVQLRYRLDGATVRTVPSTAGRALAAVGPLVETAGPVQVVASGPAVLGLACPRLPPENRACAAGETPRYRTSRPLDSDDALLTVQIDLPTDGPD